MNAVNLTETAYDMPTGMLLHEAGRQFAMGEVVHDGWQQRLYERGGWFMLLVWAERTAGVQACCHRTSPDAPHARWCPVHGEGADGVMEGDKP